MVHALRSCPLVQEAWGILTKHAANMDFFSRDWEAWLMENVGESGSRFGFHDWALVFGVALDTFWLMRNKLVFEAIRTTAGALCNMILAKVRNYREALSTASVTRVVQPEVNSPVIRWFVPMEGWVKLNSDGAFSSQTRMAACGGVVRDHFGAFVLAYAKKLGSCTVLQAELWGILHGVRLLLDRGYTRVAIETDSSSCNRLLSTGCDDNHPSASLVSEIRRIMRSFERVSCAHVFREANSVADALAKHGMNQEVDIRIFNVLPSFCSVPFLADSASTVYFRGL